MVRLSDAHLADHQPAVVERQLQVALDNMPGALVYTDENLNFVLCNDRFREMYKVPPELLQPGRPYSDVFRYLAENGYYGSGDVDALVAQRVESLRNPSGQGRPLVSRPAPARRGRRYRHRDHRNHRAEAGRGAACGPGGAAACCPRQHAGRSGLHRREPELRPMQRPLQGDVHRT